MLYESNSKLKHFSRNLRNQQTNAEKVLWSKLRGRQFQGLKFYRQFAIDNFIVDLYCHEKKLAIELDGSQHLANQEYDQKRTEKLNKYGITVLRFWDNEVLNNLEGVLEIITNNIK